MKPYEKINAKCKYGEYDLSRKASYTITNCEELVEPWYYIYQNRKVLLYVDQNGPVKIQYQPPSGILVAKREMGEKQSKLLTWIKSDYVNGGVPFNNFNTPTLKLDEEKHKYFVNWTPTKATYSLEYAAMDVVTEIFVPHDKATVCIKTTLKNKLNDKQEITVTPTMFPYVNKPQMVAWDLPEWYLSVSMKKIGNSLTFCGKMKSPEMIKENERSVTYNVDFDETAQFEMNMSKFTRSGTFFSPKSIIDNASLSNKMSEFDKVDGFGGFLSVFATKYKVILMPNEEKTFTQVITIQNDYDYNEEENKYEQIYFDSDSYLNKVLETEEFYEQLFTKRKVKTSNPLYDNFINNFAPLQMYWVGSLDRGWPSSMRGTRDASQDFTGIVPLFPEWSKSVIKFLFEHQRSDGWMPRQCSTISRQAPHDMRYFSDGGAFLLELIHEYLTFTRDYGFLMEKTCWLDSDELSTVIDHVFRTVDFYLNPDNIGQHGLVKAQHGDWWDGMDAIGLEGKGETVTVTAQMVLNLKNLIDMIDWMIVLDGANEKYAAQKERFIKARKDFIAAMQKHAYNKLGFFNGYFNDNEKWLLSDNDPDGKERLYLVSNAWAIIGGCTDSEMTNSVLENIEKRNVCRLGHTTSSVPFYDFIDKAGRVGLGGDKNLEVYNHAQSFYVRACCEAGRSDLAYNATRYILPIEEDYAPVEKTFAAPFVIANMYNNSDVHLHRAQLQYLSGTVSYVLRTVHNFFFGVKYGYNGLYIKPCLPVEFGDCQIEFKYLGKEFLIKFIKSQKRVILIDDKIVGKDSVFIPDNQIKDSNLITIYY